MNTPTFNHARAQFTRDAAIAGDKLQDLIDRIAATSPVEPNSEVSKVLSVLRSDALQALATARDLVWAATAHLSAEGRCVRMPNTRPLLDAKESPCPE